MPEEISTEATPTGYESVFRFRPRWVDQLEAWFDDLAKGRRLTSGWPTRDGAAPQEEC